MPSLCPIFQADATIIYNPTVPRSRVAFSIAHEISHTFFPEQHQRRAFPQHLRNRVQRSE